MNLKDLSPLLSESTQEDRRLVGRSMGRRCAHDIVVFVALVLFFAFIAFRPISLTAADQSPENNQNFRSHLLAIPGAIIDRLTPESASQQPESPICTLPGFGSSAFQTPASIKVAESFSSTVEPHNRLASSSLMSDIYQSDSPIPAIYIDGTGYVPLTDPSLNGFLSPEMLANPARFPEIQMVTSVKGDDFQTSYLPVPGRMLETVGTTTFSLAKPSNTEPIIFSAKSGWIKETKQYAIYFLEGDCSIRQGNQSAHGPAGVVWVDKTKHPVEGTREVTIYLETDDVQIPIAIETVETGVPTRIFDKKWLGRFTTSTSVQTLIMTPEQPHEKDPAILERGLAAMSGDVAIIQQVQYVAPTSASQLSATASPQKFRRIRLNPRGDEAFDIRFDPFPNDPNRGVIVISKGLNLIIDGVSGGDYVVGDIIDITADHAVIWAANPTKMSRNQELVEDSQQDFEVYLEGNIIYRDGSRTIEANRMYYDAKNKIAYILNAALTSPIAGVQGLNGDLHLKAEILQQTGQGMFSAKKTSISTSQLGEPTYSLRSGTLTLTERHSTSWGGEPETQQVLIAENNYIAARSMPIFYWPWMAADLRDPSFYLKNISYGNSGMYGNQVKTTWNPFQILNVRNRPAWLDGEVYLSWLEKRGIGHGAYFSYTPTSCLGHAGRTKGSIYYWGISDIGTDSLGGARRNVKFPNQYRYMASWKHRQDFDSLFNKWKGNWSLSAQVGKMSDRNFENSYFQNAWQTSPNNTTAIELRKTCENESMRLKAEYALDNFVTNSNVLPRFDLTTIGRSILNDNVTMYGHTRVGYMDYQTASAPYDWPNDGRYFRYLPWELSTTSQTNAPPNPNRPNDPQPQTINSSFEFFSTRHELDVPLNVGPVRCVPYILGDFSHWGKDRSGKDTQRFYGQTGVRLNLPIWKIQPNVGNRTWYVNGIAHKVDFDAELSYAAADKRMEDLILTDPLDSWALEDFRRRSLFTTFGGTLPEVFDPRYYALRSGLAGNVTSPNMEIADGLTLCRFGATQRWQTKRGAVGRRHIIDWITLGVHFNYYPDAKQNFGQEIGLIDYNFLWLVGDRLSLFSSGIYDTFSKGQGTTRIGAMWQRPNRGNFGVTLDNMQGIINRTYATFQFGYTMNEKYSMNYSTSFEIQKDKWMNTGHNFMFVRTGESFRMMIGAMYSESRNDWAFTFGIEPVFMYGIAGRVMQASNMVGVTQR
ncbi:MAG: hypothetical protein ACRCUY_06410 [Thermoguttaceae bacterium]